MTECRSSVSEYRAPNPDGCIVPVGRCINLPKLFTQHPHVSFCLASEPGADTYALQLPITDANIAGVPIKIDLTGDDKNGFSLTLYKIDTKIPLGKTKINISWPGAKYAPCSAVTPDGTTYRIKENDTNVAVPLSEGNVTLYNSLGGEFCSFEVYRNQGNALCLQYLGENTVPDKEPLSIETDDSNSDPDIGLPAVKKTIREKIRDLFFETIPAETQQSSPADPPPEPSFVPAPPPDFIESRR